MTRPAFLSRLFMPLAALTVAVALGSAALAAATHIAPLAGEQALATEAEQMFADAPDGVDPIVTGPVSAAFRHRQADAGCDRAAWPNIPASCYPE